MLREFIEIEMLPVQALNQVIARNPNISNVELATLFKEEFPAVGGEVRQMIWRWERPGKRLGIDDDKLNYLLLELLSEAGYISSDIFERMIMRV